MAHNIFLGLVCGIILFVSLTTVFSEENPHAEDQNVGHVGNVDERVKYLDQKRTSINQQIQHETDPIKIQKLKSMYVGTIKEINLLLYVEPTRNYLAEWTKLHNKVIDLENIQMESYLNSRQHEINYIYDEMGKIEQDSIKSMKLDPRLEIQLRTIQDEIHDTYLDFNYSTKTESVIDTIYVDSEQKKVIVSINEHKNTTISGDLLPIEIAQNILNSYGIYNVTINFQKMILLNCGSVTSDCDPLIGGISLARDDAQNSLAGSIGFRAKDSHGNVGFVTAGHVVQFGNSVNTVMRQPVGGSIIGAIPNNGDNVCSTKHGTEKGERTQRGFKCDFAFVNINNGIFINDDIYRSPRSTYDINAMAISTDQVKGTMLKMIGASTGSVTGRVTDPSASNDRIIMSTSVTLSYGDSGGPVFKTTTSARNTQHAEIFGIMIGRLGMSHGLYEPTHKIMNELNLRSDN